MKRALNLVSARSNAKAFADLSVFLYRNWRLIWEMSVNDLTGRYKGQYFGAAWVLVHPMALTFLYLFLFGIVFAQRIGGTYELPLDYTAYMLSGLMPWLTFQTALNTTVVSVISNSPLVKQFVFPIEILPVRDVLSSLVTWTIGVSCTLVYILLSGQPPSVMWVLLPLVLVVQVMAMIGTGFFLSALAVFFRDIKDLVTLFSLVAIFIMPIVFLPGWVPRVFQPLVWANPFTYMVLVYQDTIYFGRFEHPEAWLIFPLFSVFVFVVGFRFFNKTKPTFGSIL